MFKRVTHISYSINMLMLFQIFMQFLLVLSVINAIF